MPESSKRPEFLKKKYKLHASKEVSSAAKRKEGKSGEKVSQSPEKRIQNYLDRFAEILERKDSSKRQHGIEAMKRLAERKFVIKPENISESVFLLEQRIARELGHGDVEITKEFRQEKTSQIIEAQKRSLNAWIDYLTGPDALYPDWAKYWAFRSITEMGKIKKKESKDGSISASFGRRRKDTAAPFPLLNARALANATSTMSERLAQQDKLKKDRESIENLSTKLSDKDFQQLASTESFSKLYTQFLIELPEYSKEGLQEIRGNWIKYEQNSNPDELVKSLEGYPLEWCTADHDIAEFQLKGGDFYVYYSFNQDGDAKIPRVAIRMEQDSIAEVRGIAPDQHIDPYISPVIEEKMQDFGKEGEIYKKKASDMRRLTQIEQGIKHGQDPTRQDLRFLYEIDTKIQGFGYEEDPRIKEILEQRNRREDLIEIFDAKEGEIADDQKEITDKTKILFGDLDVTKDFIIPKWIEGSIEFKDHGMSSHVANRLFDAGYGWDVAENLSSFEGLDQEIANRLFDAGDGRYVAKNLSSFEGLDHKDIANRLIDAEDGRAVAENLSSFEGLDQDIANRLIDAEDGRAVARNLSSFEGLDQDIVNRLIDAGYGWDVAENLSSFEGLDHKDIANRLIDAEDGWYVAENLSSFEGLDEDFINKIKKKYS